jgi:hemerythrin
MVTFAWNNRYCIGDPSVDAQHSYLFTLAGELVESKDKETLTRNAMKLFRYVREHFNYEEALMREVDYPEEERREHVALHDQLISHLTAICQRINLGCWTPEELEVFMNSWLLGHIVDVDSELADYMRMRRV